MGARNRTFATCRELDEQADRLAETCAVVAALSPAAHAQASETVSPQVKNVVLVHGLFADGSSWARRFPCSRGRGLHVTSVQNP
jgi:pimeloyl-ACP methyl ester carboxylesterase